MVEMRIRARIEEGAPGLVLFALAATVVMITSGIVYVLFDNGSKFYRGFACGADDVPNIDDLIGTCHGRAPELMNLGPSMISKFQIQCGFLCLIDPH